MPRTEHTLQLQNQTEVRPGTALRSARLYSPERSSRRDFRSERPTLCREHQWEPAPWSPPCPASIVPSTLRVLFR